MDTALVISIVMLTQTAVGADLSRTPPIYRPSSSHHNTSSIRPHPTSSPPEGNT
jgi:hypothetical protein